MARLKWTVSSVVETVHTTVTHDREFDGSLTPRVMYFYAEVHRIEVRLGMEPVEGMIPGLQRFRAPRLRWIGRGKTRISLDPVFPTLKFDITNIVA